MSWWHLKNHYSLKSAAYEYKWTQSHNLQKKDSIIRPLFFLQSHRMRCISTQVIIHQKDCVLFSKKTGLPNVGHYHLMILKLRVIVMGEKHMPGRREWMACWQSWLGCKLCFVIKLRCLWGTGPLTLTSTWSFPRVPGAPCLWSASLTLPLDTT